MLDRLLIWAFEEEEDVEDGPAGERREECRRNLGKATLAIRSRRLQSTFHLKDMSSRGASGISDMPLAVGSIIFLRLQKGRYHAAEVRWVRNALVGLRFFKPVNDTVVRKVERSGRRPARGRRTAP